MSTYTDQLGNKLDFEKKPQRVISLVPSQSEFLWDIGIRAELVGITRFCIHPHEMFKNVERVGGTKKLNLEKIRRLQPDLIIGNKEENDQAQIETLQREFPVWMSDINDFDGAFEMMEKLGFLLGMEKRSGEIISELKRSLPEIKDIFTGQKVVYFMWKNPYMLAAKNTFIDHVLNYAGLTNAASHLQRYPEVNARDLKELDPEYCFLSSEPFPFKQEHAVELNELLPKARIMIIDGEMFSWYGSRLLRLAGYVKELKKKMGNDS
jgi:ABC-type Fe3+-hydroxamate transport system substrate-binding protein